jgi:hypothetical protein
MADGLMIAIGKAKPKAAKEAEGDDAMSFDEAFAGLCEALGVEPKDKAEAAAAFRACCAMADDE